MLTTRRSLIGKIGLLLAAPAIIRVAKLMPISVQPGPWTPSTAYAVGDRIRIGVGQVWAVRGEDGYLYADEMAAIFRKTAEEMGLLRYRQFADVNPTA